MNQIRFLLLTSIIAAQAVSGQAIALSGTVTNKANGQRLAGVTVELAKSGLSARTDSLGAYRLGDATGLVSGPRKPDALASLGLRGGALQLHSARSGPIDLALFDLSGNRIASLYHGQAVPGTRALALPPSLPVSGLLLLRLDARDAHSVYRYFRSGPMSGSLTEISGTAGSGPVSAALATIAAKASSGAVPARSGAVVDTLRVIRSGYKTIALALDSYTGVHDAALEAEGTGCAAGVLCWGFEEGRIPDGWTAYRNEYTGTLLVDGTKPHLGAFALHAKDLLGGQVGVQGGPKKTLKYNLPANFGPVLWGRAYVYTTPARPASHAGLFNARYPRPASSSNAVNTLDWYEFATYQQTYMAVWHPPEPPGYPEWVLHSDKPLVLDAWACLEWAFDGANGSQAEAADPRVWVDGLELSWPDSFVFSDPAGSPKPKMEKAQNFIFLETGIYLYQGLAQTTNWWIDDLAVGARRIGCD